MTGITLTNISKRFDGVPAVIDASLTIEPGELFFLLGPSGCGKTTILRMIAGFETPDAGDIRFGERSILSTPPHQRNTGLVFQSYALWPHMTVQQNVAYGLEERKVAASERQDRVARALDTVQMSALAQRMPNQLSGGQQQRVALARALVIEPDVVLLDEPLSNLDAKLRLEMRDEIRRIHRETGITMIYVTHDQEEALSMADRIAVMSMGRIEQTGTPREVYRRPANAFVAEFIGAANLIPGLLTAAEGGLGTIDTDLGTFRASLVESSPELYAPAWCMVRPESLVFDGSGENRFEARIVQRTYLGDSEEIQLEAGGLSLRATLVNPDGVSGTGESVTVRFRPEDAAAIPRYPEEICE